LISVIQNFKTLTIDNPNQIFGAEMHSASNHRYSLFHGNILPSVGVFILVRFWFLVLLNQVQVEQCLWNNTINLFRFVILNLIRHILYNEVTLRNIDIDVSLEIRIKKEGDLALAL